MKIKVESNSFDASEQKKTKFLTFKPTIYTFKQMYGLQIYNFWTLKVVDSTQNSPNLQSTIYDLPLLNSLDSLWASHFSFMPDSVQQL